MRFAIQTALTSRDIAIVNIVGPSIVGSWPIVTVAVACVVETVRQQSLDAGTGRRAVGAGTLEVELDVFGGAVENAGRDDVKVTCALLDPGERWACEPVTT